MFEKEAKEYAEKVYGNRTDYRKVYGHFWKVELLGIERVSYY